MEKKFEVVFNSDDTVSIMSANRSVRGFRALHLTKLEAQSVLRDLIAGMHACDYEPTTQPLSVVTEVKR